MSVKKTVSVFDNIAHSVNCYLKNGAISGEYAVRLVSPEWPFNVIYAVYSHVAERYFACTEKSIAITEDEVGFTIYSNYSCSTPFLIEDYFNGTARAIIITGNTAAVYNGDTLSKINLKYSLACGVMHCGRLFGADGLTLRWSGEGGFDDWDEGIGKSGYLLLDHAKGKVLNMLVYKGKLVAVRERGLTVLRMYGSPRNFEVDFTDTDCDGIYQNTACVVSDKLYFYSKSGLKCFDGTKICAVEVGYTVTNAKSAVGYTGRYFLACYSKEMEREVILCLDCADGKSFIVDAVADLLFVKDGVSIFQRDEHRELVKGNTYLIESGQIDFGTYNGKTVSEIRVTGDIQAKYIKLSNGTFERTFFIPNGVVRPKMHGRHFKVTVNGSGELKGIEMTAEVPDVI